MRRRSRSRDTPQRALKLSSYDVERISEKTARKLFEMQEARDLKKTEEKQREEFWQEGSDFLVCKPCSALAKTPEVPRELVKSIIGGRLGIIGKLQGNGELKSAGRLRRQMNEHKETSIHKWCSKKMEDNKKVKKKFEEENRDVGYNVILAFLKCARRGLSATDFQDNIDFLHLIPGLQKSQKNDSSGRFFQLRSDTFEVMTEAMHDMFKGEEGITEISVTLDKVTVQHRSFTVLLTLFFVEGKIYCALNDLLTMTEDDYDARGTAAMVVRCLKETLGLSRTQLAAKLVHFRSEMLLK